MKGEASVLIVVFDPSAWKLERFELWSSNHVSYILLFDSVKLSNKLNKKLLYGHIELIPPIRELTRLDPHLPTN